MKPTQGFLNIVKNSRKTCSALMQDKKKNHSLKNIC